MYVNQLFFCTEAEKAAYNGDINTLDDFIHIDLE